MGQSDVRLRAKYQAWQMLATNSQTVSLPFHYYYCNVSVTRPSSSITYSAAIFLHLLWSNQTKFLTQKVACLVAKAQTHTRPSCYFWPTSAMRSTRSVYLTSSKKVASGRCKNLSSLFMDHLTDVIWFMPHLRLRRFLFYFRLFVSTPTRQAQRPDDTDLAGAAWVQEEERFLWPNAAPYTRRRL